MDGKSIIKKIKPIIEPVSIIIIFFISSVEYTIWLNKSPSVNALYIIKSVFIATLFIKFMFDSILCVLENGWRKLFVKNFFLTVAILIISSIGIFAGQRIESFIIKKNNINNINYISDLEVIITMIIYNVLLIIPCIWRMLDYKEWIKKNKAILTLVAYLFVWFWFGCFYFYQTQRDDGNCFIFNNSKPNIDASVDALLSDKNCQLKTDEADYLREIISKDKYKIDYKSVNVDNKEIFLTTNQIGEEWGKFYDDKLSLDGYTHYSLVFHAEPFVLPSSIIYDSEDVDLWANDIGKEYIKVDLNLYKLDKFSSGTVINIRNSKIYNKNKGVILKPSKVYTLLLDKKNLDCVFYVLKNNPYAHLYNILAMSNTILDKTSDHIYVMYNNLVYMPLWDFLYFSAMTITTVGYGDITPNTTLLRITVMIEVLLGVIIIGVFVTFLTSDKNREAKNQNKIDLINQLKGKKFKIIVTKQEINKDINEKK